LASRLTRLLTASGRQKIRARLYEWWWWRSVNRPHVVDQTYIRLLDQLPADALGLDLGSRSRIRERAITLDIAALPGVDVMGDAHQLPFDANTFDYIWCNAVLEHVPYPMRVATEIGRTLKPGGLAFIQVPFLENVHDWPNDYYRFTLRGLRVVFSDLEEVASGVSAGPGQVLPDLVRYYSVGFAELQKGSLLANLCGYYWVGRKQGPDRATDPGASVTLHS
jgi:SAM-dependent methyltransferase